MPRKLEVDVQRGHILIVGNKYYKLEKEIFADDGDTVIKQIYKNIDIEKYNKQVEELANNLTKYKDVRLTDILVDALMDYPLDKLDVIEKAIKESDEVKTVRGFCTEIHADEKRIMTVRE